MTREVFVRETRWYLAFQDGPAEGDRDYATREEAEARLAEQRATHGELMSGTCVMSRTREVPLAEARTVVPRYRSAINPNNRSLRVLEPSEYRLKDVVHLRVREWDGIDKPDYYDTELDVEEAEALAAALLRDAERARVVRAAADRARVQKLRAEMAAKREELERLERELSPGLLSWSATAGSRPPRSG